MNRRILVSLLSSFFVFASVSCGTSRPKGPVETADNPPNTEIIAILGTNDIHGALASLDLKTRERAGAESVDYQAGGVAYLASYVKILRSEFGDRFLWLDVGEGFQGTIDSNSNHGAAMVRFFNTLGLNAAAIGNHEFDYGAEPAGTSDRLGALKNRMSEARYPYLAANIYDRESGDLEPFPNTLPSTILAAGKLKVGVIGLTTRSTPTTTRPENVVSLKFGDLKDATLREAKTLRERGADIVVVVAHAGLFCDLAHSQPGAILRKPTDVQGGCTEGEEIPKLLNSIPAGTVDAVVSGHTHSIVHHWIAGVPVVQGGSSGRYINLIYLTYDFNQHRILTDRTRIEGAIPVCPKIFKNQGDCNGDRPAPSIGRGPLVKTVFHRAGIGRDRDAQAAIQPALDASAKIKAEVYGQAARPIDHERDRESPLGDLVADSLRYAASSDFALVNAGGIRTNIEQGPITYGEIFQVLPFDNSVVVLRINGAELKRILRVAESGSRGFHSISGLKLRLIAPDTDAPADDLNGDHKIEPWEINRLIEARTTGGAAIDDHKKYTLATIDFLVSGGDDYGWAMSTIPKIDRLNTGIMMRDAFAGYIRKISSEQGAINSLDHPVYSSASPRLVFERPKNAKKRHSRHPHKHKHKVS